MHNLLNLGILHALCWSLVYDPVMSNTWTSLNLWFPVNLLLEAKVMNNNHSVCTEGSPCVLALRSTRKCAECMKTSGKNSVANRHYVSISLQLIAMSPHGSTVCDIPWPHSQAAPNGLGTRLRYPWLREFCFDSRSEFIAQWLVRITVFGSSESPDNSTSELLLGVMRNWQPKPQLGEVATEAESQHALK